jgi:hypothetical protein
MNQVRFSSGIKLLNEKAKAEEDYYFSKQDGMLHRSVVFQIISEKLIKHMIQDSPDAVGLTTGGEVTREPHAIADKIKLVFMKNGIPPNAHPQLLDDLVKLLEAEPRK